MKIAITFEEKHSEVTLSLKIEYQFQSNKTNTVVVYDEDLPKFHVIKVIFIVNHAGDFSVALEFYKISFNKPYR